MFSEKIIDGVEGRWGGGWISLFFSPTLEFHPTCTSLRIQKYPQQNYLESTQMFEKTIKPLGVDLVRTKLV